MSNIATIIISAITDEASESIINSDTFKTRLANKSLYIYHHETSPLPHQFYNRQPIDNIYATVLRTGVDATGLYRTLEVSVLKPCPSDNTDAAFSIRPKHEAKPFGLFSLSNKIEPFSITGYLLTK